MEILIPELANARYIQRLEKEYELRFCRPDEIDKVIQFIDNNWKKDHILVKSREMMDWQHFDSIHNQYNFVLAIHKKTLEIHAILGFIPTSFFSLSDGAIKVWAAIWKTREDIGITGLGLALYNYLQNNLDVESITISGVSSTTISMYHRLNFETGILKQWYILNKEMESFTLVGNVSDKERRPEYLLDYASSIMLCTQSHYNKLVAEKSLVFPRYKSPHYYIKRFFEHPIYNYKAFAVTIKGSVKAIIFTRVCGFNEHRAIRIVDYIGDFSAIRGCHPCFQQLLRDENAEYIDFINIGFDEECLSDAGFLDRKASDIVIPEYYEPFCQKNIDISYAFKTINPKVKCLVYKADADQDRPSLIKGGQFI